MQLTAISVALLDIVLDECRATAQRNSEHIKQQLNNTNTNANDETNDSINNADMSDCDLNGNIYEEF